MMSTVDRKLYHFVSKLIFDTRAGVLKWENFGGGSQGILDDVGTSFTTKTIDGKSLDFSVTLDKDKWYQKNGFQKNSAILNLIDDTSGLTNEQWLRNCIKNAELKLYGKDGNVELSFNFIHVSSLPELYLAIFSKYIDDNEVVTPAAEQTIDLILNANKETASR